MSEIRTAHDLIASIFSRPQQGVAGNMRRITRRQMLFLKDLIGQDEEGGALRPGSLNSLVWMPRGRMKYVITEDVSGEKHTLTKLMMPVAVDEGSLFPSADSCKEAL
jgi:hypothetical protein